MGYRGFRLQLIESAHLVGKYGFPELQRIDTLPQRLIPFNQAKTETKPENKWVHFFIDDYQFERIWNFPTRYINILKRFEGVISADYSMFTYMPKAQVIWNCYRNRAISYWLQKNGIDIIPVVEWSEYSDFSWCLDGLPKQSTLAIGMYGTGKSSSRRYGLIKGIEKIC